MDQERKFINFVEELSRKCVLEEEEGGGAREEFYQFYIKFAQETTTRGGGPPGEHLQSVLNKN